MKEEQKKAPQSRQWGLLAKSKTNGADKGGGKIAIKALGFYADGDKVCARGAHSGFVLESFQRVSDVGGRAKGFLGISGRKSAPES